MAANEQIGHVEMKYVGYHDPRILPLKNGDIVTIKKGTPVTFRGETLPAGRTYKIKINHVLCGITLSDGDREYLKRHGRIGKDENPKVVWAGAGGYWAEADINDIPEANA